MASGVGLQAIGQFGQGIAGYDAGKYTRGVMRVNAIEAERAGAARSARIRDAARQVMGRQVAGMAASGFQLDGSAKDALRESQVEAWLDILTTEHDAASRARGLRSQGDLAYMRGRSELSSGILSGAATLINGASDYAAAGGG